MKVAIVVPYSWSFLGGVVEHATNQALSLHKIGIGADVLLGYDPPGLATRLIHPGEEVRREQPPPYVRRLGRTVAVYGNASKPKLILSPRGMYGPRRVRESEYDLVHIHEPLTPIASAATLLWANQPTVATFHAAGASRWRGGAYWLWGFLLDRIDYRIAVSATAQQSACDYLPGRYEIIPNGVTIPPVTPPLAARANHVVFIGRPDPRKGLQYLLRAWPRVRASTGSRLRIIGTPPSQVRALVARHDISADGIDPLGSLYDDALTQELANAQLLVAPSVGSESFGMVLTRAFACGTPVVASDIEGYRDIVSCESGYLVAPRDPVELAETIEAALADRIHLAQLGTAARVIAESRYGWDTIAQRLHEIYRSLLQRP